MIDTTKRSRWLGDARWIETAAVVAAVCAVVTLGLMAHTYVGRAMAGRFLTLWQTFVRAAAFSFPVAALTPLLVYASRRFRIERRRALSSIAFHLVACVVFCVAHGALQALVFPALDPPPSGELPPFGDLWRSALLQMAPFEILTYWAIVGVAHAVDYRRELRVRELRSLQLEARLAQAQLEVLRVQLHPHFLFNTLHAISALIHEDPRAADRVVARLSDMLRLTLGRIGVQEVPLGEEVELLRLYLEIQQIRFQDRLGVRLDVEPGSLEGYVPSMLLQPLVENSIRHGIAPLARGGEVEVRAARRGARLELEVRDNGRGLPENGGGAGEGIGLANTRARLDHLYGGDFTFELGDAPGGGAIARLTIPYRTAASSPGGGAP